MNEAIVAVCVHPERHDAIDKAAQFVADLHARGATFLTFPDDLDRLRERVPQASIAPLGEEPAELAVVFGGDGSILRAAEWAVPQGVPLLGVNLGHVGFLAELEPSDLGRLPDMVAEHRYTVEERLALRVRTVGPDDEVTWESLAVNEVSLEKLARERMLNVLVSVDGRPLSRWGCDGVLVTTPTGSTAYGFSAGGPVVWPDVRAMLVVPLAAHALFNRPLVLSPESSVVLDVPQPATPGILWCDGRRSHELSPTERLLVDSHDLPVRIARLNERPFADRLVAKFQLPVDGWRQRSEPAC